MSRSTANVSFYCRESKKNKDGLAPIEMVIILNTRRCFIQLPRKEYPEKFRAQTSGKKRTDLIDYLDGVRARLNQIVTNFHPELLWQLITGYWQVMALMALGFVLHFAPKRWEDACKHAFIKLPIIAYVIILVAVIVLIMQVKSSDIQPFIYFQF